MEFKNSYDKFLAAGKERLEGSHVALECVIPIESDEEVVKILAVNANANTNSTEALTGEASVNGDVYINLIYLTTSGAVGSCNYNTPFVTKLLGKFISPACKLLCKAVAGDLKVLSVQNNTIKLTCIVNVSADLIKSEEVNGLCGSSETVCLKNEDIDCVCMIGDYSANWIENSEITLKEHIGNILNSNTEMVVKKYECGANFITIEGEMITALTYMTAGETPTLKTAYLSSEFKQEIEAENMHKECAVDLHACVVRKDAKTSVSEKNDETVINIENPVKCYFISYEVKKITTVCDLYCTTNGVNVTNSSFENIAMPGSEYFEKKIDGSLTLSENEPRIDKLLGVTSYSVTQSNAYVADEKLQIEGVVYANLIYLNDDEGTTNSVDIEIPYVLVNDCDYTNDTMLSVTVNICEVDCMAKKGRDIYLDAKLKVFVGTSKKVLSAIISDVKAADPLPLNDSAIEIYFAKAGDTTWDIAKELKVPEEVVWLQNPEIVSPLEIDTNIAIYYKK